MAADKYPNFYENLSEANKRLHGTVVLYDGHPYYILAISNHFPDGIMRVYMEPLDKPSNRRTPPWSQIGKTTTEGGGNVGQHLDQWLSDNPSSFIVRKHMNSPHFRRFRPFPLGMCNRSGAVVYIERSPTRKTEQGLIPMALSQTPISMFSDKGGFRNVDFFSGEFCQTVMGVYPTIEECFEKLSDDNIGNTGAAFDRNFAIIRGPLEMLFLAYKSDIMGVFPEGSPKFLRLGRKFRHLREVCEALGKFERIV